MNDPKSEPSAEELEATRVPRADAAAAETAPGPRRRRTGLALGVAIAADVVQWLLLPVFGGGALSPVNDALDVFVAVLMWRLVGWHWAFLPAFAAELIPAFDLVPSWTLAVWIATRGGRPTPR